MLGEARSARHGGPRYAFDAGYSSHDNVVEGDVATARVALAALDAMPAVVGVAVVVACVRRTARSPSPPCLYTFNRINDNDMILQPPGKVPLGQWLLPCALLVPPVTS